MGQGTSCWVEERRRLGAEVKAAVAQAAICQQSRGLAEQPTATSGATRRKMAAYLARRGGLECGERPTRLRIGDFTRVCMGDGWVFGHPNAHTVPYDGGAVA